MPELPEVETLRRGLAPHLEGRRITGVELRRPDLRLPFPERLAERITAARIEALGRRAKYLILPLSSGETLVLHLGMSGRLLVLHAAGAVAPGKFHHPAGLRPAAAPSPARADGLGRLTRHDHVLIALEGGVSLVFNDPRRFGFLLLHPSAALDQLPALAGLGVEPLGNAFSPLALAQMLAGRRTAVKLALLDQRLIAGLGNIYVCEALFCAGIHPARPAATLTAAEIAALFPAIRAVLEEAIAAGGSSLRDFRHEDGALGYFQHRFAVYGREGEACPACGGLIGRIPQGGRSSFFCAACQV